MMNDYINSPSGDQYPLKLVRFFSKPTKNWVMVQNSYLGTPILENHKIWVIEKEFLVRAFNGGVETLVINDLALNIFDWVEVSKFLELGNTILQDGVEWLTLSIDNYYSS